MIKVLTLVMPFIVAIIMLVLYFFYPTEDLLIFSCIFMLLFKVELLKNRIHRLEND